MERGRRSMRAEAHTSATQTTRVQSYPATPNRRSMRAEAHTSATPQNRSMRAEAHTSATPSRVFGDAFCRPDATGGEYER